MRIIRSGGVVSGLLAMLLLAGCGETYRPVVIPFPTPGGDPQAETIVVVGNQGVLADGTPCDGTNSAGVSCPGSTTDIDVAGDVNRGNHVVGENPWSAVLINSAIYTANNGNNTLSTYSPFLAGGTTGTTSMPLTVSAKVDEATSNTIDVAPVNYIATMQGTALFTTMPACATVTSGVCTAVNKTAPGVMAYVASGTFSQAFQVGNNPMAVVELPNSSKVYVLNEGSGSVTVFAAVDRTRLATITGFSGPTYAVPTPDSAFLFVLNRANSTVGVVKTSTDSLILSASFSSTATPVSDLPPGHSMYYDVKKQRLWVTNASDDTVTVFDVSQLATSSPAMPALATVHLPAGSAPFAVTVLSDGTRGYALNAGSAGVAPSVSAIDGNSFVGAAVPNYRGTGPRDIVSSFDGTKVYVVNHDPTMDSTAPVGTPIILQQPGTNIIKTSTNSFLTNNDGTPYTIVAPFQDIVNCTIDTPQTWLPSRSYAINAAMVPPTSNGHAYRATVAGTSAATAPAFCTTSGCTFTDGGVTWLEIGAPRNCPRQRPNFALAQR